MSRFRTCYVLVGEVLMHFVIMPRLQSHYLSLAVGVAGTTPVVLVSVTSTP